MVIQEADMVQEGPAPEVVVVVGMRGRCRDAVLEKVEAMLDVPPLIVAQVYFLCREVKVA